MEYKIIASKALFIKPPIRNEMILLNIKTISKYKRISCFSSTLKKTPKGRDTKETKNTKLRIWVYVPANSHELPNTRVKTSLPIMAKKNKGTKTIENK